MICTVTHKRLQSAQIGGAMSFIEMPNPDWTPSQDPTVIPYEDDEDED